MSSGLRIIALLVVAALAFIVWGYTQHLVVLAFFPVISPRPVSEMIFCSLAGAAMASIVSSVPTAALFRSRAWVASLVVAAPVVALRSSDITYSGTLQEQVRLMGVIEAVSYSAAVVIGAWLISRRWPRSNFSSSGRGQRPWR